MKNYTAPITTWIWVGATFVFFQLFVIIYYSFNENKINKLKYDHYFDQVKYITEELQKDSTGYKVIIIGTSLIGNGVACPEEIKSFTNQKSNLRLFKIWGSNDLLEDFVSNNLINNIISWKPDLVLFQSELTTINFSEKNILLEKAYQISNKNKSVLRYLSSFNKTTVYDSNYRCYPKNIDVETNSDTIAFTPAFRSIKDLQELDYLTSGFISLSQAGIKSVIVDIPRPVASEKIINTESFNQSAQTLIDLYKGKYSIVNWKYTGPPIYFKNCVDLAHLNKSGRKIYTNWLLNKIQKER